MSEEKSRTGVLSPDGTKYLAVFRRNQFKIFRGAVVEHSHVDKTEVYEQSAASWIRVGEREIVILGCVSGRVQIWDVTLKCELLGFNDDMAKLVNATTQLSSSSTTTSSKNKVHAQLAGIAYCGSRNSVFVASSSTGIIVEFDLESRQLKQKIANKASGITAIAVGGSSSSAEKLAIAVSGKIKIFNVSDGHYVTKFTGTLNTCTSLAVVGSKVVAADSSDSLLVYVFYLY